MRSPAKSPSLPYRLHLASAVLDPLQVHVAEAGSRNPLQAVHIVLVYLDTKHLRVSLDVVPLGVGLQRLVDGGVLEPGGQLGGVHQVVNNTLEEEEEMVSERFPGDESSCLDKYLQVVGDEQLAEVVDLQHGGSVVFADAVALQQVLSGGHLPRQPAQVKGSVA